MPAFSSFSRFKSMNNVCVGNAVLGVPYGNGKYFKFVFILCTVGAIHESPANSDVFFRRADEPCSVRSIKL